MPKLDQETEKAILQNQSIASLVAGDGWREAKRLLYKKLSDLDSISKAVIESKTPTELKRELDSRASVIDIIGGWIAEIEGTAYQQDNLMEILSHERETEYIENI